MDNYKKTDKAIDKIWTIPNLITALRTLLVIPIVIILSKDSAYHYSVAFVLVLFAYLTDSVDGFVARKTGQTSNFGAVLDPVSDKVIAISISLTLALLGKLPWVFFIILAGRDLLLVFGGILAYRKKHLISLPLFWGKLSTFVLGTLLALYPLRYSSIALNRPDLLNIIVPVVKYGTWLSGFLIIFSFSLYSFNFIKNILRESEK